MGAGRSRGTPRWLHGRKMGRLAGVRGENTRKLGFRREKFREQEGSHANSPGGLSKLGEASGETRDANRGRRRLLQVRRPLLAEPKHKRKKERAWRPRRNVVELVPYLNSLTRQRIKRSTAAASQAIRRDPKARLGSD